MVAGILNINKPKGLTSHQVILRIRKLLGTKRVGHTGILDPPATGVLPVCIGKALKIVSFLLTSEKEYWAEMRLGVVTDTDDAVGRVIETRPLEDINLGKLEETLRIFQGSYEQVPPMFSALRYKGRRLYELAREGVEVKRASREIYIYKLEVESYHPPYVTFRVVCSKGTYIRTLCADIGKALGCGAHLTNLVRTRCGIFHLREGLTLEEVEKAIVESKLEDYLYSLEEALAHFPSVKVKDYFAKLVLHGHPLTREGIEEYSQSFRTNDLVRVNSSQGFLLGIGRALASSEELKEIRDEKFVIRMVRILEG